MSNLMRYDPFGELLSMQRRLDRLFGSMTPTVPGNETLESAMDMYETDNEVVVKMSVPGFKPEDIQVTLTGDTLTVKGEVKDEKEEKDEKRSYLRREIKRGSFQRAVMLPSGIKGEDTKAEFKDGVLVLTLPKAEEVKPRTIQVKTKMNEAERS